LRDVGPGHCGCPDDHNGGTGGDATTTRLVMVATPSLRSPRTRRQANAAHNDAAVSSGNTTTQAADQSQAADATAQGGEGSGGSDHRCGCPDDHKGDGKHHKGDGKDGEGDGKHRCGCPRPGPWVSGHDVSGLPAGQWRLPRLLATAR
jgi:hypothetical protein